jgi:ribonuclease HI
MSKNNRKGSKWPEEKMRRWVTLYTDAGWKEGRGRCGFIARGSVAPVWHRGSGNVNCDSSAAAEAVAVLFGLRETHATFSPNIEGRMEGVFLRSDNLQVVDALRDHWQPSKRRRVLGRLNGDIHRAIGRVFTFCEDNELRLLVKHVPGHSKEMNKVRRWMNDQADRLGNMRGR